MDLQTYVNIFLTIATVISTGIGALVMFILAGLRSCIDKITARVDAEKDQRHQLAIKLSDEYVSWVRLLQELKPVSESLQRIETKLDNAPCNRKET